MEVVSIIGFLAFLICIVALIINAIRRKPKKMWAIGIPVSFVVFVIGAVNTPSSAQQSIKTPVASSTPTKTTQEPQASTRWVAGNDYILTIINTGTSSWYGFKITVTTANDTFTDPYLRQDLVWSPGTNISIDNSALVDSKGNHPGPMGIWNPGKYVFNMTTKTSTNGVYQNIALTGNSSNVILVTPETPIPVAAWFLYQQYEANSVAADMQLKGKTLDVTGIVNKVGKNVAGDPYVLLTSGDPYDVFGVQAIFANTDKNLNDLARLSVGMNVTVEGYVDHYSLNVILGGCRVVPSAQ